MKPTLCPTNTCKNDFMQFSKRYSRPDINYFSNDIAWSQAFRQKRKEQKKNLKRSRNSHNNRGMLSEIDAGLYFMIIYGCINPKHFFFQKITKRNHFSDKRQRLS